MADPFLRVHAVNMIYDSVRRFSPQEQRDDMTLIVARCRNC